MSLERIIESIQQSINVKTALLNDGALLGALAEVAEQCTSVLVDGGKIIFCGNGGSFADAQHLSAEFTSRFLFDRPGLPSLALGTNSSAMTAIGNDYGYENVFARELQAIVNPSDLLIAITTSGNSRNILKAIEVAKAKSIPTVVFTGEGRGKLPTGIDTIHAPSRDTARIQECHILMGHILCEIVESNIFADLKR